ncbi:hypothetical protein CBQ28_04370 [Pseudoalteromonas sp. GCY]|uniref:glycine-rich domain-containing protein n=1 Tax=Pseudoalteromonas sp. GCY TaxID=2003316 RepID=UPI000BFF1820|nr:hypothetical protein [Pseudoalteromonas sp. GCY]PHI38324.1 hypothetical protein CBQ28_04370 [Pseudoalteromonas sp. GCY]QQQ65636.1 hypothetical protein JJQ94_15095 [Pseudoalteromonas sp. GCY]
MNSAKVSGLLGVHYLDAIPAIEGQILEPNNKYVFGYDIAGARLPPSDTLQIGDWIEVIPPIGQNVNILIQIIDNTRLFSIVDRVAFDRNNPLVINGSKLNNYSYNSELVHRYRFNGRDWQPEQMWTTAESSIAGTQGVKVITESQTFIVPAGVSEIFVDVVAAGGGAGGGATVAQNAEAGSPRNIASGGSGGGGGAAVLGARINVTSGQQISVVIGSNGIGGYSYTYQSPQNKNGSNGTSAGNTIFGEWIEVEGGKNGKGGTYLLNTTSTSSISPIIGGAGGRVLKNTTNGQEFNGGQGGNSGTTKPNNSTSGTSGESIHDKSGGTSEPKSGSSSGGGGGGASALGDGGNIRLSGANYGGGGGSDSGHDYTWSTGGIRQVGNGGRSMVKIAWSI